MDTNQERHTRCECRCGYTCNRECGLELIECINTHYTRDCDHVWGKQSHELEILGGYASSVKCTKCGIYAISHDAIAGP